MYSVYTLKWDNLTSWYLYPKIFLDLNFSIKDETEFINPHQKYKTREVKFIFERDLSLGVIIITVFTITENRYKYYAIFNWIDWAVCVEQRLFLSFQ